MPINDTDRMYCEIYHCKMSVAACIARQKNAQDEKLRKLNKPGALDVNCQNCKQGKKIMEKHEGQKSEVGGQKPDVETQVCKQADCEHGGKPQPIKKFQRHYSGIRLQTCKDCMVKKREAGRQRKEKKRLEKELATDKKSAEKTITICFEKYPEIYQDLIDLAEAELRTSENQALFILKRLHEKGLHLEV